MPDFYDFADSKIQSMTPEKQENMGVIQKACCSDYHMMVIKDKKLYALGSDNMTGRMGLGIKKLEKNKEQKPNQ